MGVCVCVCACVCVCVWGGGGVGSQVPFQPWSLGGGQTYQIICNIYISEM